MYTKRLSHFGILLSVASLLFSSVHVFMDPAVLSAQDIADVASVSAPGNESPLTPQWMTWGAAQYTVVDDGPWLWIGATGGVIRWEKATQTDRRYTIMDGLPHTKVLAIAVDSAGNRWFGGDGGLSRLDSNERWTHFTVANSDLPVNLVDAIAVTSDDTLYLSHGLPHGGISRRQADGSWRWFPTRETAVQADYALIQQTGNRTPLWSIAGSEIWSGYAVFDGAVWQDRTPPNGAYGTMAMAVDQANHVWALEADQYNDARIYEWNGTLWTEHDFPQPPLVPRGAAYRDPTTLAVDTQGTVWVGFQGIEGEQRETAGISTLSGDPLYKLEPAGPVVELLATAEGVWDIGPRWLTLAGGATTIYDDVPYFMNLTDLLADSNGNIWFYSGYRDSWRPTVGVVQILNDNGTAALHDDQWQALASDEYVTVFERMGEDVWFASQPGCYLGSTNARVVRYHGPERVEYALEGRMCEPQIHDMFAQDEGHIWFTITRAEGDPKQSVLSLDDRGTPTDTSDDLWQTIPIETNGTEPVVAVDANGHLWYGDSAGLYRYDGTMWKTIDEHGVCDLVPAADGTLFARTDNSEWPHLARCSQYLQYYTGIMVVRPDETTEGTTLSALVESEPDLVRTANRRNTLWAIAADGAIWYIEPGVGVNRRDGAEAQSYPLPVSVSQVERLAVDSHNHPWLLANSQLWRLLQPPTFTLAVQPETWLLAPNHSAVGQILVNSLGGYSDTVTLTVLNPPSDLTVNIDPNPLAAGHTVQLTLRATPAMLPATHHLDVQASDGRLTHTVTLTVIVAAELHELHLPVIVH